MYLLVHRSSSSCASCQSCNHTWLAKTHFAAEMNGSEMMLYGLSSFLAEGGRSAAHLTQNSLLAMMLSLELRCCPFDGFSLGTLREVERNMAS